MIKKKKKEKRTALVAKLANAQKYIFHLCRKFARNIEKIVQYWNSIFKLCIMLQIETFVFSLQPLSCRVHTHTHLYDDMVI